jgi:hypothetical protein
VAIASITNLNLPIFQRSEIIKKNKEKEVEMSKEIAR